MAARNETPEDLSAIQIALGEHRAAIAALNDSDNNLRNDIRGLRADLSAGLSEIKAMISTGASSSSQASENTSNRFIQWAGIVITIILVVGGGVFGIVQTHVAQDIKRLEDENGSMAQKIEDMRAVDAASDAEREHLKSEVTLLRDKYYDWMMREVEELRDIRKHNLQREMWGEPTGATKP